MENEVVIIGAGPAGSVCGYLLRQAGVDCVIVDLASFPREKNCGGGLTPKAYELLQDLMPGLRYDYQGVNRFRLMMDGKTLCVVDLAKELRMVRRKDFDYELLKQYQALGGKLVRDAFSHFEELADGSIQVTLKSGKSNVILIGDAGGFANKLTYEGLYYAIATGRNACTAILEGKDFPVTNRDIFRKKRGKEVFMTRLFYSRLGLWLVKLGAHSPRLIKKAFEMNY